MNTTFLLLAEFETSLVPLELVAKRYLGIDKAKAYQRANKLDLPFPAIKGPSPKSPWLVDIRDLAEWWDRERAAAVSDWRKLQS